MKKQAKNKKTVSLKKESNLESNSNNNIIKEEKDIKNIEDNNSVKSKDTKALVDSESTKLTTKSTNTDKLVEEINREEETKHMKTYVTKRDGSLEEVSFDKVFQRINKMCDKLEGIDPVPIAQQVIGRICNKIKTSELDELTAKLCASMVTEDLQYGELAKNIIISNNHKNTSPSFSETMNMLWKNVDVNGKHSPIISKELYELVMKNKKKLNSIIDYERDYLFDYFGYKTLEKAYLKKINGEIVERPQHMWLRISLGLNLDDIKMGIKSYEFMSLKYFTQATPTLFHSGTPRPQCVSCFLMGTEDSIDGIYKTISDCAKISKWAGGIGVHISNIRSKGTTIRGTNGKSDGIIPMLRVYNNTAKYVNQCFTPDTLVFSKNKGICRVDEIEANNDALVTKDGSYRNVNKVFERIIEKDDDGNGETLVSYTNYGTIEPVRCTNVHQIRSLDQNKFSFRDTYHNLKAGAIRQQFKCAGELREGDYVVYPIPQFSEDIKYYENIVKITGENKLENYVDYFYIYGCLLAYGKIEEATNRYLQSLRKYTVSLDSIEESNRIKIENIKSILDSWEVPYTNYIQDNKLVIYWKRVAGEEYDIEPQFMYETNKEPVPSNVWLYPAFYHLPRKYFSSILCGIINKDMEIKTTSQKFAHGIRYLLLRNGILANGTTHSVLEKDKVYHRNIEQIDSKIYELRIPPDNKLHEILDFDSKLIKYKGVEMDKYEDNSGTGLVTTFSVLGYFTHNNYIYTRITHIESEKNYTGKVYDFNVSVNHNYLTHGGLVHNSGKRPGAFAMYLEPHHPDILDFLDLKKNHGNEEDRARDLFLAVWLSDLFMERVEKEEMWSLFDPDECPELMDKYGEEYKKIYLKYEEEKRFKKQVPARDIWWKILDSQIETGVPYVLYKDSINHKSNQKHYGLIRSSNLCAEIVLYSDKDEYACCVLASLGLSRFVDVENKTFDHKKLVNVIEIAIHNLNNVIDVNYYPVPETRRSNELHRPLGLGVQGLADVFMLLNLPFDSEEARELNKQIFETIYYGAVKASCKIAKKLGKTYPTYEGSPMSKGIFQFDMWGVTPTKRWNWNKLREDVAKYGVRNSTLISLMPTASTSQILGNNECIEPYTSNLYVRRTIAGDFIVINQHLIKKLTEMGMWCKELKDYIVANNGSVQDIQNLPDEIKQIFKTVWEIKQKTIIDMSADRAPYVCQTQSLNLFFEEPTRNTLTKAAFYGWKRGLKTGSYYIRSRPRVQPQQFTINPDIQKKFKNEKTADDIKNIEESNTEISEALVCSLKNPGACESCSS